MPPPSQGIAGLLILNFLEGLDVRRMGPTSPDFYNALIQATKWAFEKRDRHLCDPLFHEIPIPKLLAPLPRVDRTTGMAQRSRTNDIKPAFRQRHHLHLCR